MRRIRISLPQCFFYTIKQSLTNLACLSFFIVATAFYSFYYAWPYMAQLPEKLDTIVVDLDGTNLTKNFIREFASTPELNVIEVTNDKQHAIDQLKKVNTNSYITIPKDFTRDVLAGNPTAVSLIANGSFLVVSRYSMAGIMAPVQAAYQKALAASLIKAGIPASKIAERKIQPPPLVTQNLYNVLGGYLNFVVPIVFCIIFQTAFIAGIGFLFNDWFRKKDPPATLFMTFLSPTAYWVVLCGFWVLIFGWMLFVEGFIFWFHGAESMQNVAATMASCAIYAFAIASMGMFLAMMFGRNPLIAQFIVLSSMPLVFISGYLYAWEGIPVYMKVISWFFPSTPAIPALVRASQVGAPIASIDSQMLHMIVLGVLYLVLGIWRSRLWLKRIQTNKPQSDYRKEALSGLEK